MEVEKTEKHRKDKSNKEKGEFLKPKSVTKLRHEHREDRQNRNNQLRKNKITEQILRKRGIIDKDGESSIASINATNLTALIDHTDYMQPPKLCVFVSLNQEADCTAVSKSLYDLISASNQISIRNTVWTGLIPLDLMKGKERLTFVESTRKIQSVLDLCKVADFIVFVTSLKSTKDLKTINKDPYQAVTPIDETGYEIISAIRAQGMLPHLTVVQDIDTIDQKYHSDLKKVYMNYLTTELTSVKVITASKEDDYKAIIRSICNSNTYTDDLALRKHRSYMLCDSFWLEQDKSNSQQSNLIVQGYLKGNTLNNFNYVHLTGLGDYIAIEVNDEVEDPCPRTVIRKPDSKAMDLEKPKQNQSIQKEENIEAMNKNPSMPVVIDHDEKLAKYNREAAEQLQKKIDKEMEDLINFDIKENDENISFQGEEDEDKEQNNTLSNKHKAKTAIAYRTPDEMEVADEVDTPIDELCRVVFKDYRGLSSMATGSWDPLKNLPKEYSYIYSFENIRYTQKQAIKKAHENGLKISGKYIRVTLKNFSKQEFEKLFEDSNKPFPLVLSTLLDHERKLCVMHAKVRKSDYYTLDFRSCQLAEMQIGFRRFLSRPVISSEVGQTDKLREEKKLTTDRFYTISVFAQLTYSGAPVIMLRPRKSEWRIVASGTANPSDCNKIILSKIVLTGYPLKVHKRKAIVRYMFFNPEDVNYFKPVPLTTKLGLKGNILESLGTHGYMKCMFSDTIKHHDTICMSLYKRVFPVWFKESWKYQLGLKTDLQYENLFYQDQEDSDRKEAEKYNVNVKAVEEKLEKLENVMMTD